MLTLILLEDVQQDATKSPVSYHQVSLLLCDFFMPMMEQLLSAMAEQNKCKQQQGDLEGQSQSEEQG